MMAKRQHVIGSHPKSGNPFLPVLAEFLASKKCSYIDPCPVSVWESIVNVMWKTETALLSTSLGFPTELLIVFIQKT